MCYCMLLRFFFCSLTPVQMSKCFVYRHIHCTFGNVLYLHMHTHGGKQWHSAAQWVMWFYRWQNCYSVGLGICYYEHRLQSSFTQHLHQKLLSWFATLFLTDCVQSWGWWCYYVFIRLSVGNPLHPTHIHTQKRTKQMHFLLIRNIFFIFFFIFNDFSTLIIHNNTMTFLVILFLYLAQDICRIMAQLSCRHLSHQVLNSLRGGANFPCETPQNLLLS